MDEVLETLQAAELWTSWSLWTDWWGRPPNTSGATVAQKGFHQSVDRVGSTAGSEWDRLITISCYSSYININVWKAKEASW